MAVFKSLKDKNLIKLIQHGSVGILPTDTVYGIVASAANKQAVDKLYTLKSREQKPGTVVAADINQLVELGVKYRYLKAVEQFWPGPVSVEIPHRLDYLSQNTYRQGFRIPKDKNLQQLLKEVGPLLTTSANMPTKPVANTIEEAQKIFSSEVDFYVDGGDLSGRPPSTIIRIIDDAIEIVRQGAVKISEAGRIES